MNVLLPFRTQPSPSGLAVVLIPPESLPEPGSVSPHAPSFLPDARSGTYFFFWASLPKSMMCPVQRLLCDATVSATDGSTRASSSITVAASRSPSPAPPSSSGHVIPMNPSSPSFRTISKGNSCDSSCFMTAGRISFSANSLAAFATATWPSVGRNSMAFSSGSVTVI